MELKKWCQEIHLKAVIPSVEFTSEYVKAAPSINEAILRFAGVKTDVPSDLSASSIANLKISLIMSDFVSVFLNGGSNLELVIAARHTPYFPKIVALTDKFVEQIKHREGKPIISTGYLYRDDEESQNFLRQVESLAESGRLMVRPTPIVVGFDKEPHADGGNIMKAVPVEPNSPGEAWFMRDAIKIQNAIPLKEGRMNPDRESEMCSFALPYLEGLSFEQLSEILDSEEDSLAEFRNSVRSMLLEVPKEPSRSNDILNDIVRPATDKIERRFKSISTIHGLKVAGVTVSTATLSLLALTNAGIGAALASVLGASGLGLITKEYTDYLKDKADLREMPFYLLWRLGRQSKK